MIEAELNRQFTNERANAAAYEAVADSMRLIALDGAAHWFEVQAGEEEVHARMIAEYLVSVNAAPVYDALPAAPGVQSLGDALAATAALEFKTTAAIHTLYHEAVLQEDLRAAEFLPWFVTEQREEERAVRDLLQEYRRCEGNWAAVVLLDKKMGKR